MHVSSRSVGSQDVYRDALPMVAADIAEASGVLCFEFQCMDVADAMILRRYAIFCFP